MGINLNIARLWIGIIPFLFGCAATHPGQDAVLWVQTAAEYRAGSLQSYASAERMLAEALADRSWTAAPEQKTKYEDLPPAVILDVDETVLDNSPFNAALVRENKPFDPSAWADWVGRESAEAVPGAREFVQAATDKGIAVFFITNRACPREATEGNCPQEGSTLRNLEKCGFPEVDPSRILMKNERLDWSSEKASRRAAVAETHRILMLIGDDLGDFIPGTRKNITPEQRRNLADRYRDHWGKKWFMLPNPVYGSWRNILPQPILDNLKEFSPKADPSSTESDEPAAAEASAPPESPEGTIQLDQALPPAGRQIEPMPAGKSSNIHPIPVAEQKASILGRKVLKTGREMTLLAGEIIRGGCWDFVNAVYNRAGFPSGKRSVVFRGNQKKGPYADIDLFQPGDWLYYVNHWYKRIEHSAIFVDWIDPDKKMALMLSYGGERRKEPARYLPYDLSNVYYIVRPKPE